MRVLVLDARERSAAEIGIDLITLLAFPLLAEEQRRGKIARKLHEQYLRERIRCYPQERVMLRAVYADVFGSRTATTALTDRLQDAMDVGALTLALIKEPTLGEKPLLPAGLSRPSIHQMVRYLQGKKPSESEETYEERLRTFEGRVWRQRSAIRHLAAAYQLGVRLSGDQLGSSIYVDNLEHHRAVTALANAFVDPMSMVPQLNRHLRELIRLVWRE